MQTLFNPSGTSILFQRPRRKCKVIPDLTVSSGSESDEGSDEDRPVYKEEERVSVHDHMSDFYTILKAMRQLRLGNQGMSMTCLSIIASFDLSTEYNLTAVTEPGSTELLLNVAEANDVRCRVGALKILKQLSRIPSIADQLLRLGISGTVVSRMYDNASDINLLAAQIIFQIGWRRKASRALRRAGAIPILVSRLKLKKALLLISDFNLYFVEKENIEMAKWVAFGLWSMSKFTKNKLAMLATGIIAEIRNILLSGNKAIMTPVVGVLSECSTIQLFKLSLQNEGLVGTLLLGIQSDDVELQRLCSLALSRAAGSNPIVREMIRFHKGPKIIMKLITGADKSNIGLLTAAISALWKSAKSEENVKEFENLDAVTTLIEFMEETHEEVLVVTAGAIAEMAKSETAREVFIKKGAMTEIISLLGHINEDLLVNAAQAVGVCSDCDEGIAMLDKSDGLRLLWSLLKNSSRKVKVQALWSVKPCVMRHPDSGELIRSLMGSLSLLVQMLLQDDLEVLTAVCAVISEVALDLENLAVMTEQGVVDRLSSLITREKRDSSAAESRSLKNRGKIRYEEDELRIELHRELASAVANCSSLMENRRAFGRAGVIPVVVDYLKTTNPLLLAQACRAMNTLSQDHLNCVSIQSCGAVPYLLTAVESECQVTQIGAAGALRNIRSMLLEADERKIAFGCLPRIERLKKLAEIDAIVRVLSGPRDPFEEKAALMKGIARPSLRTLAISKAKGKGKDSSITWAETQKPTKMMRKQSSVLSWRERMSLMSQATSDRSSMGRRSTQSQSILQSKAAMRRGTMRADSVASLASQGSRASDAPPPTEYATLDVELDAQGIPKVMDDDSV